MKAALRLAAIALALTAAQVAVAAPPDEEADDYAVSPSGRRFRVRFDPASRVRLGIAGAMHGSAAAPEILAGIGYRGVAASGQGSDRITWQLDHRFLDGWVTPETRAAGSPPALDAALYGLSALRHDQSPNLVIPSSPPIGIPFPFDVGLDSEIGRVTVPGGAEPRGPVVHVGVVRAAVVFDPWRSGRAGRSFEIGAGARYEIDVVGGGLSGERAVHRIAPMTDGSLRLRLQDDSGLFVFDCRGDVVPQWSSDVGWTVAALSSARIERTLIAALDQPIVATFEGGYRHGPASRDLAASHDLRVSLGLSVNLALR